MMNLDFLGEYEVSMDSKNRIIMPSKWRGKFGKDLIILEGFEGGLQLWSRQRFFEMLSKYDFDNLLDPDTRVMKRKFMGGSREIAMDKWFRFGIPTHLIKEPFDRDSVLLRGNGDSVEIWPKKVYEKWDQNTSIEEAARKFSDQRRFKE